jgi:hypothetical protein
MFLWGAKCTACCTVKSTMVDEDARCQQCEILSKVTETAMMSYIN